MVLTISDLSDFNEKQTQALMDYTLDLLLEIGRTSPVPPPFVAKQIFQKAGVISGLNDAYDPYRILKQNANDAVLAIYDDLKTKVAESSSPLEMAIKLSALGNILDFAIIDHRTIDILKEVDSADDLLFEKYDYHAFLSACSNAKNTLILGDNAGEIVFDKIFIETLKAHYPDMSITYAVRHQPIINDITLKDAEDVGMSEVANTISSGSMCPGTYLRETAQAFNDMFRKADLIISKGQGNYETLNNEPRPNLFFIFRVKCKQVAQDMNARLHSLILWQNPDT